MTGKQWTAWLSAGAVGTVMAGLLLLQGDELVSPVSLANMTKAQKDSVIATEVRSAKFGDEIMSMRSATARITKLDKGRFAAKIYTAPVNYLDGSDSTYKPIDLTVREISELAKLNPLRKFDKYVDAGVYRSTWMNGKPHDYTFYKGDYSVSYTALFDTADVHATTEFSTVGVKQTYTFKDIKSVQDLKWLMSSNTVKQRRDDGSISFSDSAGTLLFLSPAPTAWDAKYAPVLVISALSGDTLTYTIDLPEDAVFPVTIDPTSVVATNDGYIQCYHDTDYATARNAITGDSTDGGELRIGLYSNGTYFGFRRSFVSFAIPDMVSVSAASFFGEGNNDSSITDFIIYILASSYSTPLVVQDYDQFDGWQASGAYNGTVLNNDWNSSSYSATWNEITFNAAGRAAILAAKTTTLKLALISKEDYDASVPVDNEYIYFDSSVTSGKEPYLSITFTPPVSPPTDFANTGATTTTLSYSWTDNSDNELGFKIKNAGGDTVTVGTYDAEAETGTVEGLGINTRHGLEVRSFNAAGWSAPSDSVVTYTLANTPNAWNFTNVGVDGTVDVGFGANSNPASTEYAVRDSTNQEWVQTDGTLGATIAWATYATWDAVTITDPGVTGTVRYGVMARNGDSVNTAEVTGELYVYKFPAPSSFAMTALSSTSIQADWTNENANYDSLLIMNDPEHTGVVYAASGSAETVTKTGLTPNTIYTWFVRADSSGTKADSDADSLYTLANPPTTWAFTETSLFHVTPSFNGNSNPATTQYAIRDSLRHVWVSATGTKSGTKVWRTEAQWEAITISGLLCGEIYRFGVVAKNGDEVETTYLWSSLTMSSAFTSHIAVEDGALVSQNATYATARDATSGTYLSPNWVGQDSSASGYGVYRSWLQFPTPSVMKAATACTLFVYGYSNQSTTDFKTYLFGANAYRPTLEEADFDQFNGRQAAARHDGVTIADSLDSSGYSATWNKFIFNAAGLDSLENAPDTLAIALISYEDYANSTPAGVANTAELIGFEPSSTSGKEPYISFTYTTGTPTNFVLTTLATTSLIATWDDNADDEMGYRIIDYLTGAYLDSADADSTYKVLTGLDVNTSYVLRVQVIGGIFDEYASNPDSNWTLANTPGSMTLTKIDNSNVKFVLNVNGNPSYTKFCVNDSISGKYVYSVTGICSLGVNPVWYTYSQLGSSNGDTLGISAGQIVALRAKAKNTNQ